VAPGRIEQKQILCLVFAWIVKDHQRRFSAACRNNRDMLEDAIVRAPARRIYGVFHVAADQADAVGAHRSVVWP
jgi:hypothetical protein